MTSSSGNILETIWKYIKNDYDACREFFIWLTWGWNMEDQGGPGSKSVWHYTRNGFSVGKLPNPPTNSRCVWTLPRRRFTSFNGSYTEGHLGWDLLLASGLPFSRPLAKYIVLWATPALQENVYLAQIKLAPSYFPVAYLLAGHFASARRASFTCKVAYHPVGHLASSQRASFTCKV